MTSKSEQPLLASQQQLSQEQSKVEIFEIGTGGLAVSLEMRMRIGEVTWSPCGRFISAGSVVENSGLRILEVRRDLYEQVLNMLDALKFDPTFWTHFNLNLEHMYSE